MCVSCDKFLATHYTCGGKPNVVVSITDFLIKLYFHLIIIAAHQFLIRVIAHNHALLPSCMYTEYQRNTWPVMGYFGVGLGDGICT